jgi:DNA-binding transcriptional ArsR family regulator
LVDPPQEATVVYVSDVETMRVCTHPVRSRIFRALREVGPMTASRLGNALGESSGLMSYHLRKLEQHGFVAEDTSRARGRERWWRLAADHFVFEHPDPLTPEHEREIQRIRNDIVASGTTAMSDFFANESAYPTEWREVALFATDVVHLTAEELAQVEHQLIEVLSAWHRFAPEDRPPDALPVRFSIQAVPTHPPGRDPFAN